MSRIQKPLTLVRILSKGKTHKAGIKQKTCNTQVKVEGLDKRIGDLSRSGDRQVGVWTVRRFLLGLVVIRRQKETVVRTNIDRSCLRGLSVCITDLPWNCGCHGVRKGRN